MHNPLYFPKTGDLKLKLGGRTLSCQFQRFLGFLVIKLLFWTADGYDSVAF
jgi:hypothetical protein